MTLEEYIGSLRRPAQFHYAIKLIRLATPLWEDYAAKEEEICFYNAVGSKCTVDKKLVQRTVDAVEAYLKSPAFHDGKFDANLFNSLSGEWWSPIADLNWDEYWGVSEHLKLLLFAVHNLLQAAMNVDVTTFKESTIYVCINQVIDALTSSKRMTFEEIGKAIDMK